MREKQQGVLEGDKDEKYTLGGMKLLIQEGHLGGRM